MQGLGLFTLEELHYSPQGVLLTRGPGSYKIPAFGDIPTNLTVSLLRDAPHDKAIFSSKVLTTLQMFLTAALDQRLSLQAVGEPPLFLAASIFYAIKDAIAAARRESGLKGPFRLDSPASAERIRNACIDRFTQQVRRETGSGSVTGSGSGSVHATTSCLQEPHVFLAFQCPPAEPGSFTPWSVRV